MKRVFVDTNVFLRFLTEDDAGQSASAAALFALADAGLVRLITGPPVLFELVWTLRRAYRFDRARCLEVLASLLAWETLEVVDRERALDAVDRARASGEEFADAYIASSARSCDAIATFNQRDFEALGATLWPWTAPS
jgi:predicted nucleic acid-binding protein